MAVGPRKARALSCGLLARLCAVLGTLLFTALSETLQLDCRNAECERSDEHQAQGVKTEERCDVRQPKVQNE